MEIEATREDVHVEAETTREDVHAEAETTRQAIHTETGATRQAVHVEAEATRRAVHTEAKATTCQVVDAVTQVWRSYCLRISKILNLYRSLIGVGYQFLYSSGR